MKHQGERERPAEEHELAAQEDRKVGAPRPLELLPADAARGQEAEVLEELPLDGEEAVERPEVEMLEAMEQEPRLGG